VTFYVPWVGKYRSVSPLQREGFMSRIFGQRSSRMFRRFVSIVFFVALAVPSFARDVLVPVVTGTAGNRTFRTTIAVTNRTNTAAECVFTYRSSARPDHPLVSRETIAAGGVRVYKDFLLEMSAAGTIRADCPAGVEVVTRLQDSSDGGRPFAPVASSGRFRSITSLKRGRRVRRA
jgi:hypothetical protein